MSNLELHGSGTWNAKSSSFLSRLRWPIPALFALRPHCQWCDCDSAVVRMTIFEAVQTANTLIPPKAGIPTASAIDIKLRCLLWSNSRFMQLVKC